MRKYSIIISALVLAALASAPAYACTNVLVTRGASADGSNIISYAADSHQLFGELYFLPGASFGKDAMRDVYDWDSNKYLGRIPQVAQTFSRVGNVNEKQLVIGETTSAAEFADSFDHEKGHLVKHICQAYDIDPYGEEAEYIAGNVAYQMFTVAKDYLCDCCRKKKLS